MVTEVKKHKQRGMYFMKRLVLVLLAGLVAVSMAACGNKTEEKAGDAGKGTTLASGDGSSEEAVRNGYKIGYAVNVLDEAQTKTKDAFVKEAEANGCEVVVTNADGSVEKQLSDIEALAAQGCDMIGVIAVDSEGLVPAIDVCKEAGIPMADISFGINGDCDMHIIADLYEYTANQSSYLKTVLDENPELELKIGYIWGAQGTKSASMQYEGFHDTLFEEEAEYAERCELLVEKVCDWKADQAQAAIEDWMQAFPEMNCVVAMSDEMALAVVEALKASGENLDEWIVVGKDGSDAAIASMKAGELDATSQMRKADFGAMAAKTMIAYINGEDVGLNDEKYVYFNEFRLLTKENIGEYD